MEPRPDHSHEYPPYTAFSGAVNNPSLLPSASASTMNQHRQPLKRSWQVSELGHDQCFNPNNLHATTVVPDATQELLRAASSLSAAPFLFWSEPCVCDHPESEAPCDGDDGASNCNDPETACYDASCVSTACPQCPEVCETGQVVFPCTNESCADDACHYDVTHVGYDEPDYKRARVLQYLSDSHQTHMFEDEAFSHFHAASPHPFQHDFADAQANTLLGYHGMPLNLEDNPYSIPGLSMPLDYTSTPTGLSDSISAATPTVPDVPVSAITPLMPGLTSPTVTDSLQPKPISKESSVATDALHRCEWVNDDGFCCNSSFDDPDSLHKHVCDQHLKWLNKMTTYKCRWETCDRHEAYTKLGKDGDFKQRSKLERHIQTHTGYKACKCSICGEHLASKQSLDNHMRTHTKEKPFACNWPGCGKKFAVATALHTHKRTHTGERPLVCNECGRSFPDSSNLSSHKANVHKVNTGGLFMCTHPGCNKSFQKRPQLEAHQKRHIKQEGAD